MASGSRLPVDGRAPRRHQHLALYYNAARVRARLFSITGVLRMARGAPGMLLPGAPRHVLPRATYARLGVTL